MKPPLGSTVRFIADAIKEGRLVYNIHYAFAARNASTSAIGAAPTEASECPPVAPMFTSVTADPIDAAYAVHVAGTQTASSLAYHNFCGMDLTFV
jgi:hypothetical protein